MEDLKVIQDIVNQSVRDSSYITVIISSCVFICYTIIIRVIDYFKSKSKSKPLIEMAVAIKENTSNIVKLNSILDKTLRDAERKTNIQCEKAIENAFKALAYKIVQETSNIIAHNNVAKNKEFITSNISRLISTEYYKLYSALAIYEIKEINVASKLKEEWIKELSDNVLAIIYDEQDELTRIVQLNNKIAICVNEYSTYINNKIFNT